jgi:hypothetical protein
MKNYKIFGERILVEKVMTQGKSVLDKEQFKGEVKVLAIGEEAVHWGINIGDKLVVSGMTDFNNESYVHKNQIMRWC